MKKSPKVAIVCDWLVGGGAERVVQALHETYPDAPIYTSRCNKQWREILHDADIRTGFLQHQPFVSFHKFIPMLRAWWFSRLNLKDYDIVISASGAEAKGVRVRQGTLHVNYCHSPTHYYWTRYDEYLQNPGFGLLDPLARLGLRIFVGPMRRWDYKAAQRPDYIMANSGYTQRNIKKYYGRESVVVHPPVDVGRFTPRHQLKRAGFVITGRQTPYKRIDLAVAACTQLGLPLTVIGNGPVHQRLQAIAGEDITFLDSVSHADLPGYLQKAEGFILPNADDFGIAAVEALAAGTPVVAFKGGGALDYIDPGSNGIFFEEQTIESLCQALQDFVHQKFNHSDISHSSRVYSTSHFVDKVKKYVSSLERKSA